MNYNLNVYTVLLNRFFLENIIIMIHCLMVYYVTKEAINHVKDKTKPALILRYSAHIRTCIYNDSYTCRNRGADWT